MKGVLSILAVAAILFGAQSCKKCGHCEVNGFKTTVTYCEKDNEATYKNAKSNCENVGSAAKWVTE
jgi:hypothetical protein